MIINMNKKTGIKIAYHITDRKIEYIALAVIGFSNKRIAEILNVEETTVKQVLGELFVELLFRQLTNSCLDKFKIHKILGLRKNLPSNCCVFYFANFNLKPLGWRVGFAVVSVSKVTTTTQCFSDFIFAPKILININH